MLSETDMKKIAVLTSGGDSEGMNKAVVSVVRTASRYGITVYGVKGGYLGLIATDEHPDGEFILLNPGSALNIADLPGTFLGTARCDEFRKPEVRAKCAALLKRLNFDGLVVIGGDGSMTGAGYLCGLEIPCIGIPGTIDNDLGYTEKTVGFDTAVNTCLAAVRAVRATSRSHYRAHVVEVMGRHSGNIAVATAAAAADLVMVPEHPMPLETIVAAMKKQVAQGNRCPIIVAAEGCWFDWPELAKFDVAGCLYPDGKKDPKTGETEEVKGLSMNAEYFSQILEMKSGIETRHTVVGYAQRGGIPTADDSIFAFKAGELAVQLLLAGEKNLAIGIRDGRIFSMPISEALNIPRRFDEELYRLIWAGDE